MYWGSSRLQDDLCTMETRTRGNNVILWPPLTQREYVTSNRCAHSGSWLDVHPFKGRGSVRWTRGSLSSCVDAPRVGPLPDPPKVCFFVSLLCCPRGWFSSCVDSLRVGPGPDPPKVSASAPLLCCPSCPVAGFPRDLFLSCTDSPDGRTGSDGSFRGRLFCCCVFIVTGSERGFLVEFLLSCFDALCRRVPFETALLEGLICCRSCIVAGPEDRFCGSLLCCCSCMFEELRGDLLFWRVGPDKRFPVALEPGGKEQCPDCPDCPDFFFLDFDGSFMV